MTDHIGDEVAERRRKERTDRTDAQFDEALDAVVTDWPAIAGRAHFALRSYLDLFPRGARPVALDELWHYDFAPYQDLTGRPSGNYRDRLKHFVIYSYAVRSYAQWMAEDHPTLNTDRLRDAVQLGRYLLCLTLVSGKRRRRPVFLYWAANKKKVFIGELTAQLGESFDLSIEQVTTPEGVDQSTDRFFSYLGPHLTPCVDHDRWADFTFAVTFILGLFGIRKASAATVGGAAKRAPGPFAFLTVAPAIPAGAGLVILLALLFAKECGRSPHGLVQEQPTAHLGEARPEEEFPTRASGRTHTTPEETPSSSETVVRRTQPDPGDPLPVRLPAEVSLVNDGRIDVVVLGDDGASTKSSRPPPPEWPEVRLFSNYSGTGPGTQDAFADKAACEDAWLEGGRGREPSLASVACRAVRFRAPPEAVRDGDILLSCRCPTLLVEPGSRIPWRIDMECTLSNRGAGWALVYSLEDDSRRSLGSVQLELYTAEPNPDVDSTPAAFHYRRARIVPGGTLPDGGRLLLRSRSGLPLDAPRVTVELDAVAVLAGLRGEHLRPVRDLVRCQAEVVHRARD